VPLEIKFHALTLKSAKCCISNEAFNLKVWRCDNVVPDWLSHTSGDGHRCYGARAFTWGYLIISTFNSVL